MNTPPNKITCACCGVNIVLDAPVKVWSMVNGVYYFNRCIEKAMENSQKLKRIEEVLNPPLDIFGSICDVWVCDKCGGRSGGYGRETCYHCGLPAHYGSDNGHYELSAPIKF